MYISIWPYLLTYYCKLSIQYGKGISFVDIKNVWEYIKTYSLVTRVWLGNPHVKHRVENNIYCMFNPLREIYIYSVYVVGINNMYVRRNVKL